MKFNIRAKLYDRLERIFHWKAVDSQNYGQLQAIENALNSCGHSLFEFKTILDFGCGEGRLTLPLTKLSPAIIFGCDVISHKVKKAARKMPRGHFFENNIWPPLDIRDATLDFIYSYSVFTHLTERNHCLWLAELAHKLKPGGVMLHTVHSMNSLERQAKFSPHAMRQELNTPGEPYRFFEWNPKTPEYGVTIISKEYILKNWERISGLRLIRYQDAAIETYPEGCHDIVILKKVKQ